MYNVCFVGKWKLCPAFRMRWGTCWCRNAPFSLSQGARGVAALWRVVGVLVGKSELIVVWGLHEVGDYCGRTWGISIDEVGGTRGLCHLWGLSDSLARGIFGDVVKPQRFWWWVVVFGGQVSGVGGLCGVVFVVFGRWGGVCVVWEYYRDVGAKVCVRSGNTVSVISKVPKSSSIGVIKYE